MRATSLRDARLFPTRNHIFIEHFSTELPACAIASIASIVSVPAALTRRRYVAKLALQTIDVKRPSIFSRAEADELEALALRLERLIVWRKDPEWFFVERSEIVFALRLIARRRHA
jgi:hypothetical protein